MSVRYYVTFSGINGTDKVPIKSANFGGNDPAGSIVPSDVVIELASTKYSPLWLQAFAVQSVHRVVVTGYRPNVQGLTEQFVKITVNGAKVISYHLGGAEQGNVNDTMHLSFTSIDFSWVPTATDYVWTVA